MQIHDDTSSQATCTDNVYHILETTAGQSLPVSLYYDDQRSVINL